MLKDVISKVASYGATMVSNPEFLIGAGVGILVVDSVYSFMEGIKAQEDIAQKTEELGRELTKPERYAIYAKRASGVAIGDAFGIAMVYIGSKKQSKTIQLLSGSLQAASIYSNTQSEKAKKLENKMKEVFGEKKVEDAKTAVGLEQFKTNPPIVGCNVIDTGKGNRQVIFYFEPTGDYFFSSYEQIALDQAEFNKIFMQGEATMRELKDCLGIPGGTLDNNQVFTTEFQGDYLELKMKPDEGGWVDVNGTMHQYCLLRLDRDPDLKVY